MATRNENQPYNTSTADYKLWSGFIRNLLLTTCGWTATADTGQTNPTTVGSAPTAGNYNYEVYQATDSLASGGSPLVIKVEYGQKNSVPSIAITLGTGSNGTGTITGGGARLVTNFNVGTGTASGSAYECAGAGDASGFRFLMWRNNPTTSVPCFFAIERARNSSGAYIGDYATIFFYGFSPETGNNSGPVWRQQTVLSGGSAGSLEPTILTFQSSLASAGLGSNVCLVPAFPMPGYLGNPSEDILCGKGGDFAEASSGNSVSIYGSSHTYYFSKVSNLVNTGSTNANQVGVNAQFNQVVNNGLLFRYE